MAAIKNSKTDKAVAGKMGGGENESKRLERELRDCKAAHEKMVNDSAKDKSQLEARIKGFEARVKELEDKMTKMENKYGKLQEMQLPAKKSREEASLELKKTETPTSTSVPALSGLIETSQTMPTSTAVPTKENTLPSGLSALIELSTTPSTAVTPTGAHSQGDPHKKKDPIMLDLGGQIETSQTMPTSKGTVTATIPSGLSGLIETGNTANQNVGKPATASATKGDPHKKKDPIMLDLGGQIETSQTMPTSKGTATATIPSGLSGLIETGNTANQNVGKPATASATKGSSEKLDDIICVSPSGGTGGKGNPYYAAELKGTRRDTPAKKDDIICVSQSGATGGKGNPHYAAELKGTGPAPLPAAPGTIPSTKPAKCTGGLSGLDCLIETAPSSAPAKDTKAAKSCALSSLDFLIETAPTSAAAKPKKSTK